jgi:hypothetical protein
VDDAPEGHGALVEKRSSRVVLESGELSPRSRLQLALEQDIADHADVAGNRLVREECGTRHERAVAPTVSPPEELVAAAHGQQRDAARMRSLERLGL